MKITLVKASRPILGDGDRVYLGVHGQSRRAAVDPVHNLRHLVVESFVGRLAADDRIKDRFAQTDIPRLKMLLVEQICEATGGPCHYSGKDMKTTHADMNIIELRPRPLASISPRRGSMAALAKWNSSVQPA